jgi:pullulanase
VLNYVSCHDNYTLYDQLVQTMPEARLAAAYTQADAVVFLAQGVPFIQEGEEFMRSKYDPETGTYEGNSYKAGDRVNAMDYALKIRHADVFRKTQELIAFRLARPELRLATRQEITDALSEVETDGGNLRYTVGGLTVIHTVSGMTAELPGTFRVLYSNLRAAGEEAEGSITLLPNESVVLEEVH